MRLWNILRLFSRRKKRTLRLSCDVLSTTCPSVSNTSGSSAGFGSGDFHQYRQMRQKEQDRLARMEADYHKRKEFLEFNMRREERLKAAEERTATKRLKHQKIKERRVN